MIDENHHNFAIKVDVISHTMTDSNKIIEFFKYLTEQQLANLKDKIEIQKLIEEIVESNNIDEFIEKFKMGELDHPKTTTSLPEATILKLGAILHDKKLTKKLSIDYGKDLFLMEQKELCKIKGIGKKKAEAIELIGNKYKKAKIENLSATNNNDDVLMDTIINAIFDIKYDNSLLNNHKLLQEAAKYGMMNQLIDLGSDDGDVATILIDAANEYGVETVIHTIFAGNNLISTQQQSEKPQLLLIADDAKNQKYQQPHTGDTITKINKAGAIALLTARDFIEYGPTLKYFANDILHLNITTPELTNNAWASIHFVLGTASALALSIASNNDISIISAISASTMSSVSYATRVQLYENVNQYTENLGLLKTIGTQIVLSLVNGGITKAMIPNLGYSAIAYDMAISASIGGMKYYQANYPYYNQEKSTFEIIIPYAADAITMFILAGNINIPTNNAISYMIFTKQALAAVSTVVTVDYMTKMTMNMVSDYIDADYLNECLSSFSNYFYGNNDFYGNNAKDTENVESVIEATYTDLDSDNVNMMGGAIKEELVEVIEL
jgi:hypothetical protein